MGAINLHYSRLCDSTLPPSLALLATYKQNKIKEEKKGGADRFKYHQQMVSE